MDDLKQLWKFWYWKPNATAPNGIVHVYGIDTIDEETVMTVAVDEGKDCRTLVHHIVSLHNRSL